MTDPLSITASVAGIFSLSLQLSSVAIKAFKDIRSAPQEYQDLVEALTALEPILIRVGTLAELQLTDANHDLAVLQKPLAGLRKLLLRWQTRLNDVRMNKHGRVSKRFRLRWVLRKGEAEEVVAAIEGYKTTLLAGMEMVLMGSSMKLNTSLDSHANAIIQLVQEARREAVGHTAHLDGQLRAVLVGLTRQQRRGRRIHAGRLAVRKRVRIGGAVSEDLVLREFQLVVRKAAVRAAPWAFVGALFFLPAGRQCFGQR